MKILLATSSVTPNAGIPSFNRELCSLLNVENEMHLLVDENIESYRGYAKIYSITGINIYNFEDASELLNKLQVENYDVIIKRVLSSTNAANNDMICELLLIITS